MKDKKSGFKAKYEDTLFDNSFVHQIDIRIAEADWTNLLRNPVNKTRYTADITIDGESLKNTVLSTKGFQVLSFRS